MTAWISSLLASALLVSCSIPDADSPPGTSEQVVTEQAGFDTKDYELISVYFERSSSQVEIWPGQGVPPDQRSWAEISLREIRKEVPELRESTFASFQRRNRNSGADRINAEVSGSKLRFSSDRTVARRFARVGLSHDGAQALIYQDVPQGGGSWLSLYSKTNGTWTEVGNMALALPSPPSP